ncbi:mRNA-decapping enzyme-like protein [Erysiphe necator]|uniref:Putative dcp1 superfamily decapping enzyme n=1 Tax=Uncinula necator TaxID=52586 RepID=A0A0B1P474_UNCNE|nr:mRNA-decapping enzyme-like protein [Erysiphe necator]KHJ31464.1 putative dcp1 superfamily decapping enzyme [Erysiphe necator]
MDSNLSRLHAEMNFSVLRRYVPSLRDIIAIAASASIYTLTPDNSETGAEWKRADIEGTLFVCELGYGPDQHCLVVLNRKGRDNLIIQFGEIVDVEVTNEFLILRFSSNGEARILGFFIQCSGCSREEICELIKGLWEAATKQPVSSRPININENPKIIETKTEFKPIGRKLSLSELFGRR